MQRSLRFHLRTASEFVIKSFLPAIAFLVAFYRWGSKAAIAIAVLTSVVQLTIHLVARHRISPFFLTSAFFTVVFGGIDLVAHEPRYYRLAPFAENFIIGSTFLATVLMGRPIAVWFADALPPQIRPDLESSSGGALEAYLRKVTWLWIGYFYAKAFLFLYLAFVVDLGRLIVLRAVIGGPTIVLMLAGEVLYRKKLRRKPL